MRVVDILQAFSRLPQWAKTTIYAVAGLYILGGTIVAIYEASQPPPPPRTATPREPARAIVHEVAARQMCRGYADKAIANVDGVIGETTHQNNPAPAVRVGEEWRSRATVTFNYRGQIVTRPYDCTVNTQGLLVNLDWTK